MTAWRRLGAPAAFGAAILLLSGALTGCNIFYQSPFPGYVPLIQNQVDVSDRFPYDPGAEYRVEVVNGGTGDYVVILAAGPALGERLAIYDADLKEQFYRKDSADADEFDRESPVIIDAVPNLYVGQLAFGPGISGPVPLAGPNVLNTSTNLFVPPTDYTDVEIPGADQISVIGETIIDGGGAPITVNVNVGLLGDIENNPLGVSYDLQVDFFGIAGYDSVSRQIFVWTGALSAWAAPVVDILSEPGGRAFPVEGEDIKTLSITADGVILEEEEGDRILRFYDLFGNEGDSLSLSHGDADYAFSAAGTHFYLLRSEDEKLVKADTWW